ncbi:MAG: DNA polymerase Y family protein [Gammaproteobacteria bacterium]
MDDSDSSAQISLPAIPDRQGARIIALPVATPRRAPAQRPDQPAKTSRPALWYALYFPALVDLPDSDQQQALEKLAAVAESISSTVSYHPQALICEVRSSLKYFGGLETLHTRLQQPLQDCLVQLALPAEFFYAASPTVSGSLLLARSGHNILVYRPDNLRSALGQLSTDVLQLNKEQNRRLYNMGIRYLRDIWRLPTDGLRKRFGSELVNQLSKALGNAPEATHNYIPAPVFNSDYDLPYAIEQLDRLLPVADEMLSQLTEFLTARDLCTSQLLFQLLHEKREATAVKLGLRQPTRCRSHLLELLEMHFSSLDLPAPVIAIKLDVSNFDAFMGHSNSLLSGPAATPTPDKNSNLDLFMEQLRARLGGQPVRSIHSVAEHCPEYACQQLDFDAARNSHHINQQRPDDKLWLLPNPRPLWLLSQPQPLTVRHGRLYHRQPLCILRGPERIEARWWSGEDVRRDYYIARERNGSRLWIYHERQGERLWYLHGVFA